MHHTGYSLTFVVSARAGIISITCWSERTATAAAWPADNQCSYDQEDVQKQTTNVIKRENEKKLYEIGEASPFEKVFAAFCSSVTGI